MLDQEFGWLVYKAVFIGSSLVSLQHGMQDINCLWRTKKCIVIISDIEDGRTG